MATPVDEMLERVQRRAAQLHRRRRALLLAAPAVGLTLVASLVGHGTAGPRVRMTPPAGHVHASVSRPPGVAAQTGAGRGPTRPTAVAGPVGDAGTTSTSALSTPEPVRLAATGRVAFVRHGAIWTAKVDGSGLHPVTTPDDHLSAPEWSPDGTRLAAQWTLHDLRRVVVLELDGSYRFVTDPADRAEDGRWSPDGTRLLVFKGFGVGGGGLWTVDVDTGAQRVVSNAGGVKADWSPDGRIVYECPEGLCVMDGDGAHPRPVVAGHYARPRWSPDGTRLLAFRTSGPTQPLVVVGVDGRGEQVVSDHATSADWSPDGRWIAMTQTVSPPCPPDGLCWTGRRQSVWLVGDDLAGLHEVTAPDEDDQLGYGP